MDLEVNLVIKILSSGRKCKSIKKIISNLKYNI